MRHYSRGQRGGYRSGYRGRASDSQDFGAREARVIPAPLGPEMSTRSFEQIDAIKESELAEITDCECIASYSLMEGLQKTILVPGKPPIWTPLPGTNTLRPDSGHYYRDENAARFPEHPLEPAVKSIFMMNKRFKSSDIDIFGCGSTLGDLLRFCMGRQQPFSFTVQVVGNTVFFVRRNMTPTELIENVHGFGHAFAEAYTTWSQDVKGSASHQRIIKYSFGGLDFLVRFEADGYILDQFDDSDDDDLTLALKKEKSQKPSGTRVDDLVDSLGKKTFNAGASHARRAGEELTVRIEGGRTAQSSLFDLKTRSARKKDEDILAEQLPRLWVRQIPKFILGFHTSGRFETPDVRDITGRMYEWEQESMPALSRMVALIKDIRDMALKTEGGKLEIRGGEGTTLHFHRLSAGEVGNYEALPAKLREQWTEG